MKKYVLAGLCAAAVLAAASGCSKKEQAPETTTAEASTQAPEAVIENGKVKKLGQYKGLSLIKESAEVTDEELDIRIQTILNANPEYVEVTRPARKGDTVNIDFVGMKDGVAFDGGTSAGYDLELGSGSFIDGFEDGLMSAKTGDELSLNLTFPEHYHSEELAGQDVVFDVTVNAVKEKREAVLDDAFVQRMSEFSTVDEFKADLLQDMQQEKERQAYQKLQDDAIQAAIDATEFEVNADAVEKQYNDQISYYNSMVAMYGMSLEEYLNLFDMTQKEFEAQIHESSETIIKQRLLVDAIAEAEKLEVEDEDRQYIADQVGQPLDDLKQSYGEELDSSALTFKVVNFLVENANIQ